MMRRLRSYLKIRRRRKKLAQQVDAIAKGNPQLDWEPFRAITLYFADKSLSSIDEQAFLYRLAAQLPPDATLVEIGSWIGHSACLLTTPLRGPDARLYAVDAFASATEDAFEAEKFRSFLKRVAAQIPQRELFERHITHFGVKDRVVPVPYLSDLAIKHLPFGNNSVDLLFIDGGHTLDVVSKDIELYMPLVKSGGVVSFHDFNSSGDVAQAVWAEIQRGTFGELIGLWNSLIAFRKR
jgi:predicted O-methyltransferase YrrM